MSKIRPLEEVLAYRNNQVILMFSRKKKIPMGESLVLFEELKKWLWFLAQRAPDSKPFAVFPEQSIIDDYWHEFILNTKDYHAFCDRFFGRYIHHVATPDGILEDGSEFGIHSSLAINNRPKFIADKIAMLRDGMKEVALALGPQTVQLWYRDLPNKYFYKNIAD
ncbi:hypothetical protein [Cupriavidus gilardii]|uniref:hypothetical protein n=1 Tax=Cupriavidus gilardii TaxID=82541 RepID=UPI0012E74A9C|nr:hypothetical protein [Cupriavidus gilardii]